VGVIIKGFVYILCCKDERLYIGSTRDLNKRFKAHIMGRVKTTKGRRPVQLVYSEEFDDYSEARLKSGTGREWLKAKLERCQSG
jgi:putative endonuclease